MTGTYTHDPVFSRITLALMEDTGWYVANYSSAEPLAWGYKLGCTFVHHSCFTYGLRNAPFCELEDDDTDKKKIAKSSTSSSTRTRCTEPDRAAVGLCNLKRYQAPIPPEFRYFTTQSNLGGQVALADYCPFVQDFNWRRNNVVLRGSACKVGENNPAAIDNYALETYGPDSVCLEHFRPWDETSCFKQRFRTHWGSGCYPVQCLPTDDSETGSGKSGSSSTSSSSTTSSTTTTVNVVVDVYGRSYHCTYPGEKLHIRVTKDGWLYAGYLICPKDCRFVCKNHDRSRLHGDPNWCYERTSSSSDFVRLDQSTEDSLQCKARFSYLSDPFLLVLNILVIVLLSSNICVYLY